MASINNSKETSQGQSQRSAFQPPEHDDVLLSTQEVSAWVGFSAFTVKWWRTKGRGPTFVTVEGRPRYRTGDVRAFLAASKSRVEAA